jgi:hypothetical protein
MQCIGCSLQPGCQLWQVHQTSERASSTALTLSSEHCKQRKSKQLSCNTLQLSCNMCVFLSYSSHVLNTQTPHIAFEASRYYKTQHSEVACPTTPGCLAWL